MSVVGLAVVTLAVLTGCGKEKVSASASKNQEVHVAVVLGAHVNSPCVNLKLIQDVIYQACYSQGSVTLVVDDESRIAQQSIFLVKRSIYQNQSTIRLQKSRQRKFLNQPPA